jgi:anti-anti-sigma factor
MEMYMTKKGKYCILHIEGDSFSNEEKEVLSERLRALTEKETHIAVDLTKLKYANSRLLGQFLITYKALQKKKGAFALIAPNKSISDLLRVTGMDKVFSIYVDEKTFAKIA